MMGWRSSERASVRGTTRVLASTGWWARVLGLASVGMLAVIGTTPLSASAQDVEAMEVPLRVEDDRLIVPVDIGNGVEVDFVLSTGNAVTVLSQAFVDNHGVDGDFWLGDVEVDMDNYATVPHADLNPDDGMVVGIIGANTLNEFDLLIDAPNQRAVLQTVGREVSWEGVELGEPIRLRVYHGLLLGLDLDVVGHAVGAMIDTGTGRVVGNPATGQLLGIDTGEQGSTTLTWPNGVQRDARVHVRDLPLFERWDPNGNGFLLLGGSLAFDCAMSFSWVHREMRMCPGSRVFRDDAAESER